MISGDYTADQVLASAPGLPRPSPREFVSARLVRCGNDGQLHDYARSIRIAGGDWRPASAANPEAPGPRPAQVSRFSSPRPRGLLVTAPRRVGVSYRLRMLKRWAAWPPGIRWLAGIAAVVLAADTRLFDSDLTRADLTGTIAATSPARNSSTFGGRKERKFRTAGWSTAIPGRLKRAG